MRLILFKLRGGFDFDAKNNQQTQMFNFYMMHILGLDENDLKSVYKMRNLINITGLNMEMNFFEILRRHSISRNLECFYFL